MRFEGTLKSWNDGRGFGFIEPAQGGETVFVHIKAFGATAPRPCVGQAVSFEIEVDPKGRKRAKQVQPGRAAPAVPRPRQDSPGQWGAASYYAIPAFGSVYLFVDALWRVPGWVAGLYVALSGICFAAYALDKAAAVAGRWRVSEGTLLTLGLAGGWPGAIAAQQLLRHKSSKTQFRSTFWISVTLNVVGFILLSSPLASRLLQ